MGATPQNIWTAPAYLPYLQPALTSQTVAAAEEQIGFKLPSAFLDLLSVQNGGYIRYALPELALLTTQISGIGPNFPSLTDISWDDDYFKEAVSFELHGLVPFDGDGHWHLCLDFRNNSEVPAVTYIDVECDSEENFASSFSEYLSQLVLCVDEDEFAIWPVSDFDLLLDQLSSKLRLKFDPPDDFAHGYPVYLARAKGREMTRFVWISPNLVPRGFVRQDHLRYEELRNLLPGKTKRFPELPEQSCLFSVGDEIRDQAFDTLRQLGLEIRPLRECVA